MKNASRLVSMLVFGAIVLSANLYWCAPVYAANNYGAIAFSVVNGAHGYSYDYPSRRVAEQVALRACRQHGGIGCRVAIWFRNACGALAVGSGNGWGANWGTTRAAATRNAMRACRRHTSGCGIRRWACTTR